MAIGSAQRVTGPVRGVQARRAHVLHVHSEPRRGRRRPGIAVLPAIGVAAGLIGCSGPASFSPVDWWHGLEGGRIAETRPPPPNADAPYPNLGSVPAKPAPTQEATRTRIAQALLADRARAQYAAGLAPLPDPASAARSNAPAPRPPAADSSDAASSASLQAATAAAPRPEPSAAPTAAAPQPSPASVVPVQPAASSAAQPGAGSALAPAQAPAGPFAPAEMPATPPPPPSLPGVAAATAPTAPPEPPPHPAPPLPALPGALVVPFAPGSVLVSQDAVRSLRALAGQRGSASIAVTGYGEAASSDASVQAATLPLALDRALALALRLESGGVPAAAISINAEALGSGGAARIVR